MTPGSPQTPLRPGVSRTLRTVQQALDKQLGFLFPQMTTAPHGDHTWGLRWAQHLPDPGLPGVAPGGPVRARGGGCVQASAPPLSPTFQTPSCLRAMETPSSFRHVLTLTTDFVFFLILGFTRSTVGRGGNFFSSSRTAIAAFFFEIFLLFPSPSPTNSPTDTLVTKLFMWGGPLSRATCFGGKD